VAIIAILAAIAIPNFLAAQTRARVSKVKGEQQTLATALESYFVDYNVYPDDVDPTGWPWYLPSVISTR
jgi:type II secretory pathway pseudopilin PulG